MASKILMDAVVFKQLLNNKTTLDKGSLSVQSFETLPYVIFCNTWHEENFLIK